MSSDIHTIYINQSLKVERSVANCFNYIVDFSNLSEWDYTCVKSIKTTQGTINKGCLFDIDICFGLRMLSIQYCIKEYIFPYQVVFEGTCNRFKTTDIITIQSAEGEESIITWKAEITFYKSVKRIKLLEKKIQQVRSKTMEGLEQALSNNYIAPTKPRLSHVIYDKLIFPGLLLFSKMGYNGTKKYFNPISQDIEDKHILITGATSGIGLATLKILAHKKAHITIIARNEKKAREKVDEIIRQTGNPSIHILLGDLSLLKDIQSICEKLLIQRKPIDVLINNAGTLFNQREETKEQIEKSFALLLLSPFLLTEKLLPLLFLSKESRVINVLSGGMYSEKICLDDLQNKKLYKGTRAYARSKRGLMICTQYWAEKYPQIKFNAMHPGWVDTPGVRQTLPTFYKITQGILRTPVQGADTIIWLAIAKEAGTVTGRLWLDRFPHTLHLIKKTLSSKEENRQLIEKLSKYMSLLFPIFFYLRHFNEFFCIVSSLVYST